MNKFYKAYLYIGTFLFINSAVASNINNWGGSVQSEITSLAPSWLMGGVAVSGLLCLVGSHLAYGFLSKLIMAAALIFGSGSIVGLLQNVFN